jgi:hypothetical protein
MIQDVPNKRHASATPTEGPTNAERIHAEFVQMLAVYLMAAEEGLVPAVGHHRDIRRAEGTNL